MGSPKIEYSVRQYQPGDEDQITKLLVTVFGQWPKFDLECTLVDHWKWKFIDNPEDKGRHPHVVAVDGGEIMGVTHSMYSKNKIGNNQYLCHKSADVAVNPKYRGMGVFTKMDLLKQELSRGYQFETSVTSNPLLLQRTRQDEASPFPQRVKNLIKIKDVNKHFKNAVKGRTPEEKAFLQAGAYGLKTLNILTKLATKTPQPKDVTFREVTRFDDRINTFYEKIKPHYNFIIERTKDYLNWRYCDRRGGNFRVWIAEQGDEIVGYLVLKINKIDADYPMGYIIDLLALNGRDDVADYLAKFAVEYFDERDINAAHVQLVEGHPYEGMLGKYGLLDTRVDLNIRYRAIKIGGDFERFVKSPPAMLHYTYGEGDSM